MYARTERKRARQEPTRNDFEVSVSVKREKKQTFFSGGPVEIETSGMFGMEMHFFCPVCLYVYSSSCMQDGCASLYPCPSLISFFTWIFRRAFDLRKKGSWQKYFFDCFLLLVNRLCTRSRLLHSAPFVPQYATEPEKGIDKAYFSSFLRSIFSSLVASLAKIETGKKWAGPLFFLEIFSIQDHSHFSSD